MVPHSGTSTTVLSVFGTRPEAIKMAPVVLELARREPRLVSRVCVTGQHREMLDDVLRLFSIVPDYDIDVMRPGQTPSAVAAEILAQLEPVIAEVRPDWVLVQGDTTTAAAAALASFYAGARVAHVEAGLRSHDLRAPFPEEANRRVAAAVCELHFAPTESARTNLLREGVDPTRVLVTGNTVIDALLLARKLPIAASLPEVPAGRRLVTLTAHRRESFGRPLERICIAVRQLCILFPDLHVVFPVHPNPSVRAVADCFLGDVSQVTLVEPLGYREMVALLQRSYLVLTDSGGLQEEAPSLGKPVLVLRDVTEREEGVQAGTARLVGTRVQRIVTETANLLESRRAYEQMARAVNPYGDGGAAARIVGALDGEQVRGPAADRSRPLGPARLRDRYGTGASRDGLASSVSRIASPRV